MTKTVFGLGEIPSPSLILADHPTVFKLMGPIVAMKNHLPQTHVVVEGGITPLTDFAGINTIAVKPNHFIDCAPKALRTIYEIQRYLGEKFNCYENAIPGPLFPQTIADHLYDHPVMLFPAGSSDVNARWKSGLGRIIHEIAQRGDDCSITFMNIPRDSCPSRITGVFQLSELIRKAPILDLRPRDVALCMQSFHNNLINS